jgi:hypothetical protein
VLTPVLCPSLLVQAVRGVFGDVSLQDEFFSITYIFFRVYTCMFLLEVSTSLSLLETSDDAETQLVPPVLHLPNECNP